MLLQEALGKPTEPFQPASFLCLVRQGCVAGVLAFTCAMEDRGGFQGTEAQNKGLSACHWRRLPVLVEIVYEAWAVATRSLGLGSHEYNYCGILQTSGLEQTDGVTECGP